MDVIIQRKLTFPQTPFADPTGGPVAYSQGSTHVEGPNAVCMYPPQQPQSKHGEITMTTGMPCEQNPYTLQFITRPHDSSRPGHRKRKAQRI